MKNGAIHILSGIKCITGKILILFIMMLSGTNLTFATFDLPHENILCSKTGTIICEHISPKLNHQSDTLVINHRVKQTKIKNLKSLVPDTWIYNFAGLCSQVVSNVISKITFPHSKNNNLQKLLPHLKKWDILCIKTTYRLTNYLIPGYFGHVAIYMGDGTFTHCDLKGTRYSPIDEFSDGSSYVLLRPNKIPQNQEIKMYLTLNELIGTKYDYNYNINTHDRLICTELIYLIYTDYKWETNKLLLWDTMPPDGIVLSSLNNKKITIEYLITNKGMIKHPSQNDIKNLFIK